MPVVLAQQAEGINQILQGLERIGNIESLPGSLLIMGVMLFAGIVSIATIFWRVMSGMIKSFERLQKSQQKAHENTQEAYIEEREINRKTQQAQTMAIENLSKHIAGTCTTLDRSNAMMESQFKASEAQHEKQWQKVTVVGEGLKTDMSVVKDGNDEILKELRKLNQSMETMAANVKTAMDNFNAAITKPDITPSKPSSAMTETEKDANA